MGIGVVIPTYNAHYQLNLVLLALRGQTEDISQIVVVDDGSTSCRDQNRKTAEYYDGEYIYFPTDGPKLFRKTQSLNIGLERIETDWIFFNDQDVFLYDRNYLQKCLTITEKYSNGIVLGIMKLFPGNDEQLYKYWVRGASLEPVGLSWQLGNLGSNNFSTFENLQLAHVGSTHGNFFLSTHLAKQVKFDEEYVGWGGEDEDFLMRAVLNDGYIFYIKNLELIHMGNINPLQMRIRPPKNRKLTEQSRKEREEKFNNKLSRLEEEFDELK